MDKVLMVPLRTYHQRKLAVLLFAQIVLGILHGVLDDDFNFEDGMKTVPLLYWLAISLGAYIAYYVVTLRCCEKGCRAPQIYLGVNPKLWRWPQASCWKCGRLQRGTE